MVVILRIRMYQVGKVGKEVKEGGTTVRRTLRYEAIHLFFNTSQLFAPGAQTP